MDTTIYRLPQIKKIIEEQKYKFCSLFDLNGNTLVTYNSIKGGNKNLQTKLQEIETRAKRLTPGVYVLVCKGVYGSNTIGDKFYLGIGDFDPTILNTAPSFPESKKPLNEPENKKTKDTQHLLSIESAMDNLKELADLRAENARLTAENERLNEELDELEQAEPLTESSTSGLQETIKSIIPMLDPLADKYFSLEEKKLNFNQTKFLHENGYEIPGLKKTNAATKPNGHVNRSNNKKEVPQPGAEGWDDYINTLLQLEEEPFNEHLAQLEQNAPDIYDAVCAEVFEEGEEGQ